MSILQVEQIRQTLQDALADHAVIVQVNQFRNQLNVIINKPPGTVAQYSALLDVMRSRLTQVELHGIARIKVIGRIQSSPKPDWEEVIDLCREPSPVEAAPSPRWPWAIAATLCSFLVVFSYHLGQWSHRQLTVERAMHLPPQDTISLIDYQWQLEAGVPYVIGVVKNHSPNLYKMVQVDFELYDDDGQRIGQIAVQVYQMQPQEAWQFREAISNPLASRVRLLKIQALH